MLDVLIRAGCFVGIILLGILLRKLGVFQKEDFKVISNICLKITLPAAIVTSFAGTKLDAAMLSIIAMGFGGCVLYMAVAYVVNLRSTRQKRAFEVLNLTSYNIGCFTLPFAQSFLGPVGVIVTSLFDAGNAVICLGGSYGVAQMIKNGEGFSVKRFGKTLLSSVPLMCYVIVVTMKLAHIPIPDPVLSFAELIGSANAFVAMLMIGVGFELDGERKQLRTVGKLLLLRYSIGALLAAGFYFLLPFEIEIRRALVILALSPIGSAATAFTRELKEDVGLSSTLNSASIIISLVIDIVLLTIMCS